MREIKFRGFCKAQNKMVFGDFVKDGSKWFITNLEGATRTYFDCEKESIGQFTGLKDKNGVEIYEGDILNWDYCGSTEWKDWMKDPVYKVIYQDGYFVCAVGITKNLFLHSFRFKYCEVVGNIYQNPELLT